MLGQKPNTLGFFVVDKDGHTYAKGLDLTNHNLSGQEIYLFLKTIAGTMREKMDIPFFADIKQDMDGIIQNIKFDINHLRHEELKNCGKG